MLVKICEVVYAQLCISFFSQLQPQDPHMQYLGLYGCRGVKPGGQVDAQGPTVPIAGLGQGVGPLGWGGSLGRAHYK